LITKGITTETGELMMSFPWSRKIAVLIVGTAFAGVVMGETVDAHGHGRWFSGNGGYYTWPAWQTGGMVIGNPVMPGGTNIVSPGTVPTPPPGTPPPAPPPSQAPAFGFANAPAAFAPTAWGYGYYYMPTPAAAPAVAQMAPQSFLSSPASMPTRGRLMSNLRAEMSKYVGTRDWLRQWLVFAGRSFLQTEIGGLIPRPDDEAEIRGLVEAVLNERFLPDNVPPPPPGGGGTPPPPPGGSGPQQFRLRPPFSLSIGSDGTITVQGTVEGSPNTPPTPPPAPPPAGAGAPPPPPPVPGGGMDKEDGKPS
jgi:hypothetical protein